MSVRRLGDHPPPSLLARQPVLTGAAIGPALLLPHAFLPAGATLGLAAVLIAVVASIYFGFAVVNGSSRHQVIEFNVTGIFAVAGLLGLLSWPVLLPLAYFAHAGWDLARHNRAGFLLVAIPSWYVPWCVVIDVIVGAGLLVLWRRDGML